MRRLRILVGEENDSKAERSASNETLGTSTVDTPGVTLEQMSQIKNQLREELKTELRALAEDEHKAMSGNLHAGFRNPYDVVAHALPDRLVPLTILVVRVLEQQKGQTTPRFLLRDAVNDALRMKNERYCSQAEFEAVLQEMERLNSIVADCQNVIL